MKGGLVRPACSACGAPAAPVAEAYSGSQGRAAFLRDRAFKIFLVTGDCVLIGMQPILVHMCKVDGKFNFSPVSVNLLTELTKMVFAVIVLSFQARKQRPTDKSRLSLPAVLRAGRANILLAVPSFLYAINNYLKFIMQLYFKPATVKMLSNLKVLVIAVLLKIIMKRHFSTLQWEALCLLLIGISVNQLPCGRDAGPAPPLASLAWLYTFCSVTIPSAACVFIEYALKSQFDTSLHLQNFFMFCYGATFNALFFFLLKSLPVANGGSGYSLLEGHSRATAFLIINNALQGILSSFFFKYADTILKKYSSAIATIFTALASASLFGHSLTINFILGVSIVLISMHQFFLTAEPPRSAPQHRHVDSSPGRSASPAEVMHMASLANEEGYHKADPTPEDEPLLPR